MTLRETLKYDEENGSLILGIGFAQNLCSVAGELSAYAGICGSYIDAIHQWMTHNVDSIDECENHKYVGYTVHVGERQYRLVVPVWAMDKEVSDWKHAKNLFNKMLRVV